MSENQTNFDLAGYKDTNHVGVGIADCEDDPMPYMRTYERVYFRLAASIFETVGT